MDEWKNIQNRCWYFNFYHILSARSPVFAHLNASLQGLTSIRSNGAEKILVEEFDKLQDVHSSSWFMFLYASRAFSLWLDLICTLFIGVVTFSFVILEQGKKFICFYNNDNQDYQSFGANALGCMKCMNLEVKFPLHWIYEIGVALLLGHPVLHFILGYHGSQVGLGITQCIGLSGLIQWGMRQSAELENQMTSVERVLEFTRIEHEPDLESVIIETFSIEVLLVNKSFSDSR